MTCPKSLRSADVWISEKQIAYRKSQMYRCKMKIHLRKIFIAFTWSHINWGRPLLNNYRGNKIIWLYLSYLELLEVSRQLLHQLTRVMIQIVNRLSFFKEVKYHKIQWTLNLTVDIQRIWPGVGWGFFWPWVIIYFLLTELRWVNYIDYERSILNY